MEKLIDYLLKAERRLVSPVGGGSREKFNRYKGNNPLNPEEILARWMDFQSREYGHDLVFSTMPLIYTVKSLGLKTKTTGSGVDFAINKQLEDENDLKKLKITEPSQDRYSTPYISCIKNFKNRSDKLVGGAFFGPFTVASLIMGTEELCKRCIKEPPFIHKVLDIITDFLMERAYRCEWEGADFLWIAEPSTVLISREHFNTYSGKYLKKIYNSISIPGFLHVPGDTNHLINGFVKTGAQGLSLDSHVNMRDMAHILPWDIVVMGNINAFCLLRDRAKELEEKVVNLNREIRNFPNFIISSGGGLAPDTPEENIRLLFQVTRKFPLWSRGEFADINYLWQTMAKKGFNEMNKALSSRYFSQELILASLEEARVYLKRQAEKGKGEPQAYSERMEKIQKIAGFYL